MEAAQGGATSTCKSLQSTPALAPTQGQGRLEFTCMPTRGFRSIAHLFQQTSTPALHDRACTHCNCSIVWQHEPTQAPIRKRRSAMYYPSPRSCPTSARIGRMCGITTLITDSCEALCYKRTTCGFCLQSIASLFPSNVALLKCVL